MQLRKVEKLGAGGALRGVSSQFRILPPVIAMTAMASFGPLGAGGFGGKRSLGTSWQKKGLGLIGVGHSGASGGSVS